MSIAELARAVIEFGNYIEPDDTEAPDEQFRAQIQQNPKPIDPRSSVWVNIPGDPRVAVQQQTQAPLLTNRDLYSYQDTTNIAPTYIPSGYSSAQPQKLGMQGSQDSGSVIASPVPTMTTAEAAANRQALWNDPEYVASKGMLPGDAKSEKLRSLLQSQKVSDAFNEFKSRGSTRINFSVKK